MQDTESQIGIAISVWRYERMVTVPHEPGAPAYDCVWTAVNVTSALYSMLNWKAQYNYKSFYHSLLIKAIVLTGWNSCGGV